MKIFPDRLQGTLDRGLAPAYLFAGPETLLVLEASDLVRRACRRAGIEERIVLEADARFDWNELGLATETGSLFASRRLVDLRIPNGKAGRDGSAAIKAWLENDPEDVLLVSCMEWKLENERTAWVKAIEKSGIYMPAWTVKAAQLPRWLQSRAKDKGLKLDGGAAAHLAELMEGNLLAAAQTLDRLALNMPPGGRLGIEELRDVVDDHARFDAFRLSELVMTGQISRALRCCRGLAAEDAARPMVVAALVSDFQNLLLLHELSPRTPPEQAMLKLRIFKNKQPVFLRALERTSPPQVVDALSGLALVDGLSKGQVFGDFWQGLERWIAQFGQVQAKRSMTA